MRPDPRTVRRHSDGRFAPHQHTEPDLSLPGTDGPIQGGTCSECGREMVYETDGTAYHLEEDGGVDDRMDADHPGSMGS